MQTSAMIVKTPETTMTVCVLLYNVSSVMPFAIILEVIKVEHPAIIKVQTKMIVNVLYFIAILLLDLIVNIPRIQK